MKFRLFTLGLIAGLMASPAWADRSNAFTHNDTSGAPCAYSTENGVMDYSTSVGVIVSCNCPGTHSSRITVECAKDQEVPNGGCLTEGINSSDDRYYCVLEAEYNDMYANSSCNFCGCNESGNTVSDWLTGTGNRVYKETATISVIIGAHRCDERSRTTTVSSWGCDANYYKSSGSGSTMTCSPCPESGTNSRGTTDIETCRLSGSTKKTDDKGSYSCASDYEYKK